MEKQEIINFGGMLQCYDKFNNELYQKNTNPIYSINFTEFNNISIYFLRDYSLFPEKIRNNMFMYDTNKLFPDHHFIFTDGSKTENHTACALLDSSTNTQQMISLNNKLSNYSAELIAIWKALKYIKNQQQQKFVIFSDSKSSLEKIKNIQNISGCNYIISYIINTIIDIQHQGKIVHLAWVKAHCGIKHNEIVDKIAKQATLLGRVAEYPCPYEDLIPITKKKYIQEWKNLYQQTEKGAYYKSIEPLPPKEHWYKNCSSKNIISKICRLRFNHALVPSYLYKINQRDNQLCECGEEGNTVHMVMECKLNADNNKLFIDKIYKSKLVPCPFNLKQLLSTKNIVIYNHIVKHIEKIKLKI